MRPPFRGIRGGPQAVGLLSVAPLMEGRGTTAHVYTSWGQRNEGAFGSAVRWGVDQSFGPCGSFDGTTTSRIDLAGLAGVGSTFEPFFLSCWVFVPANTGGAFIKLSRNQGEVGEGGFGLGIGSGNWDSDGAELIGLIENIAWRPTGINLALGQWQLVGMEIPPASSGNYKFYINGAFVFQSASSSDATTPVSVAIGGYSAGITARYGVYKIADVRFYSQVPSLATLAAMYAPATRWALYQTERRRIWDVPSAAAAAGKPWHYYQQQMSA